MGALSPLVRNLLLRVAGQLGRRAKQAILLALDAMAAPLALAAALSVMGGLASLDGMGAEPFLAAAVLGCAASIWGGLHRRKLDAFAPHGLARFAAAAALAACPLALTAGIEPAAIHAPLFFTAAIGHRWALRGVLHWAARAPVRRGVLIWGAGEAGVRLAAALHADPRIRPLAFLDDDPSRHGLVLCGLEVFPAGKAAAVARRLRAARVLIALPEASPRRLAEIASALAARGLPASAAPSFAQIAGEAEPRPGLLSVPAARFLGRSQVPQDLGAARPAYAGRSVLVTGAGGSVGSELCRQLLALGVARLVLLDVSEAALYTVGEDLRAEAAARGIPLRLAIGSVTDRAQVLRLLQEEGVRIVLHAAACKHVPLVESNPIAGLSTNVLGTRAVAEAARQAGAERFVLVSTDKAVRPAGTMGLSKRLAECVVLDLARTQAPTAMALVRFGNVLGSSGSVIPRFRDQIERGGPVTLTHEEATRFFMSLTEAARLVLIAGAMARPERAETFALDMGTPVRIRDLAEQMIAAAGLTVRGPDNPEGDIAITITGLRPGEKLHEELLLAGDMVATAHPKVLRLREPDSAPKSMAATLLALRSAIGSGDAAAAVAVARAALAAELAEPALPPPASPARRLPRHRAVLA